MGQRAALSGRIAHLREQIAELDEELGRLRQSHVPRAQLADYTRRHRRSVLRSALRCRAELVTLTAAVADPAAARDVIADITQRWLELRSQSRAWPRRPGGPPLWDFPSPRLEARIARRERLAR